MKFNYSDGYINNPEHYEKFKQIDLFLEKLSIENEDEFSKELYTSGRFLGLGVGRNDILYIPNPEMPEYIERQIKKEIIRLYPLKMNFKEAQQFIRDNEKRIGVGTMKDSGPHLVKDCIILPTKLSMKQMEDAVNRYIDEKISNEDLLHELNLGFTDVKPVVLFLFKGNNTIMDVHSYLESSLGKDE